MTIARMSPSSYCVFPDIRSITFRSSHQKCSITKDVVKNFAKFIEHLCQSLFFNKVAGLRPATLFKKRLWHRCFPMNFVKFLSTPFYIEHLWWLLLKRMRNKYSIIFIRESGINTGGVSREFYSGFVGIFYFFHFSLILKVVYGEPSLTISRTDIC